MFDMNLQQLQYVADHLTEKQCRQLSEALSMDGMLLDHQASGIDEKDLSCLRLLLLYDRSDKGRAKSFVDVAIRLRQIGRPEVADQLSQMVYSETADQVQQSLLDNPFKNQIETDSPLLMKPPLAGTSGKRNVPKQRLSRIQIIGIVGGSSVLLLSVVCCYGRRTRWKLCKECQNFAEDVLKVTRHPRASLHSGKLSALKRMPDRDRANEQQQAEEWSLPSSVDDDMSDVTPVSSTRRELVDDYASDAITELIERHPV